MGDGRYYTIYQFFSVSLLVMLAMIVITGMLIGYIRNKNSDNARAVFRLFFVLVVLMTLKVVELVIPGISIGFMIRCIIAMAIIIMFLEWFIYLNHHVFKIVQGKKSLFARAIFRIAAMMLILTTLFTNGRLIITRYDFLNTRFSGFYAALLIALSVLVSIFITWILASKKQMNKLYKNSVLALGLVMLLLCPLVLYSVLVFYHADYVDFAEILIFTAFGVLFSIIMNKQVPLGLTVLAFNRIGDIIQDYIFVTDMTGKVIYRNRQANQSAYFVKDEKITIENINKLYTTEPIIKQNAEGNEYVKLKYKKETRYFSHKYEPLKEQGKTIGQIITIVDITKLMNLLFSLEDQKKKSEEVHAKLKNYSKVVYHVEKEKKINALLEEIVSSRENEMQHLIAGIEELIENEGDFKEQVDPVIRFNQKILEDVRKAVSTYRQQLEVKHDKNNIG